MISIVTINRDRPDIYRNHLLSLQNQIVPEGVDWELIILDDSTEGNDEQEAVIKDVCSTGMPYKVKAFRALNRIELGGEGKIINFGVKQTEGDPIFVLCGDDIFPSQHFFLMHRLWNRLVDVGRPEFALSWPLYHLKKDITIVPEFMANLEIIDAIPEVTQHLLARREDINPEFVPGLDVFYGSVDDRAMFPRDFLFRIKGWPEWKGSWWRDAWMWHMLSIQKVMTVVDWSSWSLHQWHQHWDVAGNAEAKAYLDKYGGKVKVSNKDAWGEAEMKEIAL